MKKIVLFTTLSMLSLLAAAQGKFLTSGEHFPDIDIKHIINAPVTRFSLAEAADKKIHILNLWGTWCSPCIPEMDHLAKLQSENLDKLQVIAISDDSPERLRSYLKKKPSKIWLATDTSDIYYSMFGVTSVGHSAIINAKNEIVAVVKTDSINQQMINDVIKGLPVRSSASIKERKMNDEDDLFRVDSTLNNSFTMRSYMQGQRGMTKMYAQGPFSERRITYVNSTLERMLLDAYDINARDQVIYELDKKKYLNYEDKNQLYCLDLLISPNQKDSLYLILQQKLKQVSPVKARIIYKDIPVFALTVIKDKQLTAPVSKEKKLSYSFSGRGFDGTAATITQFCDIYLSNELELPVVNETGLNGMYDIKTTMEMRNREGILNSLRDLGLELTKTTRNMKMLVLYK